MSPVYKLSNAGGLTSKMRYTSMLAENATFIPTSFESIATVTVGAGGSSSITFSSIPSAYKHLQIRGIVKNNSTSTTADLIGIQFNSDTGTNYARHYLWGDGSGTVAGGIASVNYGFTGWSARSNASYTNMFGASVIDILDYANTNKYKTVRTLSGVDYNGSGYVSLVSALWQNTSAITSISLDVSGNNLTQYSQFALYGVK